MKKLLYLLLLSTTYLSTKSISIQPSTFCKINCKCDTEKQFVECINKNLTQNINNTDFWMDETQNVYPFHKVSIRKAGLHVISQFPNSSVRILDLSNNMIEVIEKESFKYVGNLTEIDLTNNDLTSELFGPDIFKGTYSPDDYQPLRALKVLRIANNQLHTLHQDIFEHIMNLEVLDLHGNPLRVIDTQTTIAISGLLYLKNLDLSYTFIKKLPAHIFHTPKYLAQLYLSGNYLTQIPTALEDARSLKFLSLNENPIGNITKESGFPKMENLKILHMCFMDNLTRIEDGSLSGLWNLEELFITNNKKLSYIGELALARLEDGAESHTWPKIKMLRLNSNHLSHISSALLASWSPLEELNLNNNPWMCDCENQWLIDSLIETIYKEHHDPNANETVKNNKDVTLDAKKGVVSIYCGGPEEMKGQNLLELWKKNEILRCEDLYGGKPENDAGILIGILIGLLTCIPLILGIIFCYKKNFFGYFNNGPAAFSRRFYNPATTDDDF